MKRNWIGIDAHKEYCDAVLTDKGILNELPRRKQRGINFSIRYITRSKLRGIRP